MTSTGSCKFYNACCIALFALEIRPKSNNIRILRRRAITKTGWETTLNQGNLIKLCMSECLWRWGLSVTDGGVSSPKERLNINLGAHEISAKGTFNVSAGPSMRSGPENLSRNLVCLRGGIEEHRVPAKVKESSRNIFGPLLVAEHEDIWRRRGVHQPVKE